MKKALLVIACLFAATASFAQTFGNEWINYNARYWSFTLSDEGIYRIDSLTLANAGFPLDQVDPRDIQIFGRQAQIPLYVTGDTDGVFNAADRIEFYVAWPDNWLDSALWDSPGNMSDWRYPLISDQIQYFITWNAAPTTSRIHTYYHTYNGIPLRDRYYHYSYLQPNPFYRYGEVSQLGTSTSHSSDAEGYFGNGWTHDGPMNTDEMTEYLIPTLNRLTFHPAQVRVELASQQSASKNTYPDHHWRITAGVGNTELADTMLQARHTVRTNGEIPWQSMSDNTPVRITIKHDLVWPGNTWSEDYPDGFFNGLMTVRYAHNGNLSDQAGVFGVPQEFHRDTVNPLVHWAYSTYGGGEQFMYVWADSLIRVVPDFDGTYQHAVFPQKTGAAVTKAFTSSAQPYTRLIPGFRQVNGNGLFMDFASLQVDSAMLIVSDTVLMNGALQYAAYRSDPLTKNHYNTVVANVGELYQQYGGGVSLHPLGIRRFVGHMLQAYPAPPQALFLIGKAVQSVASTNNGDSRGTRKHDAARALCRVPSFGAPCSDNLFTLGLSGAPSDLTVPVGRLAAKNNQDVVNYLNKVISLETLQATPAAWMKNVLHFRGGFNDNEELQFAAALSYYTSLAEDTCFGAHVYNFAKSGDFIAQSAADSVFNLIQEGVTLMTIFAHASGAGFDITIDQPNNYIWNGRHPMMIGNSCYTGNLHLISSNSASEQFTVPPQPGVGTIAFLASVDLGVSSHLQFYTGEFYRSFSSINYGKGIGQHIRYAVNAQLFGDPNNIDLRACSEQMTLQGDPTVILNSPLQPDYEITATDIDLSPDPVTADVDTFQVDVTVRNIGKTTSAPFSVAVERTLIEENQTLLPIVQEHVLTGWQDTYHFDLPVLADSGGQGLNNIQARVDLDPDVVDEFEDYENNEADQQFLITTGDLVPIYPYEYAITPDPMPMLQASTGNPFAPVRTYVFQIDTTDLYNSPVMEQTTLQAPGGVVEWQPQSIYSLNNTEDSLVFFWRCSVDSTGNGGYDWHEFSFQHIPNKRGWGQAHYFQYKNDDYSHNVTYDRPERDFDFFEGIRTLRLRSKGQNPLDCGWFDELGVADYGGCGSWPSLNLAVVDPADFVAWNTPWNGEPGHSLGHFNTFCRQRTEKYFQFRMTDAQELNKLAIALQDSVPNGHFILLYTYLGLDKTTRPVEFANLQTVLGNLGAINLQNNIVTDTVPYAFFVQKGGGVPPQEEWGTSKLDTVNMLVEIPVSARSGNIIAPFTSFAGHWDAMYWNEVPVHPTDSTRIFLSGVDDNGGITPILSVPSGIDSISFDTIPLVQEFERLVIHGEFFDNVADPKPAQIQRWQLLNQPVPECAIDPPLGYFEHLDSLFEGQVANVMVAIHNVSEFDMDSLAVEARVVDANNVTHRVHWDYHAPLPAGGVQFDTISFSTAGYGGINTIVIEANPKDTMTLRYDQPEQYHFNNIAVLRFETLEDLENPMLDVTFDGMHILDGDIVSAKPEIQITLNDENETLLLDSPGDTTHFKVFLSDPSGAVQQLRFNNGGTQPLQFVPANGPANVCKILYRPDYAQDGVYQLTVKATDISMNSSGDNDYRVKFEVINKPTITEVLNYPNPFTTSTRFVFTLTGREVPSAMRIQIMTITGKVVRDIGMDELGTLRVGRNVTEYAWDGNDQFGDRLAQGVYLYRVLAQLHGQDIEIRETKASTYFTKGFGKLYLLR